MLRLGGCRQSCHMRRVTQMLKKIRECESGVALIEFALSLPIFVFAVMGGMELAWEAITRQQIQKIAATTADNAARVRGVIDETDIHEIITAARLNGEDLELEERGRLIISSFQRNSDNDGNWIRWQRCFGDMEHESQYGEQGDGRRDDSIQGLNGDPDMNPPPGVALMVAEIVYKHKPLITDKYFGERTFRYQTAFIVRDRNDLSIGNVTNLPSRSILSC